MKLSDFDKVNQIRYEIQQKERFIKDFSNKPTCIATDYVGESSYNSHQKLFKIDTPLTNVIIAELERQVAELKDQLKELGVEVDEISN